MKQVVKQSIRFTLLALLIISCGKEVDYSVSFTSQVFDYEINQLVVEQKIEATISSTVELSAQGLIYSIDPDIEVSDYINNYGPFNHEGKIIDVTNSEVKTYSLTNLEPNTVYYYYLFAVYDGVVKVSETKSFNSGCFGLGCGPAGGQIIYLDGNGGGIEIAKEYVTPNQNWGCSFNSVNTSDTLGSGQANTNEIINDCGSFTLAKYCDDYAQNGFTDYYMPSIDELSLIYSEVYVKLNNPYNWNSIAYYSSSEGSSSTCMALTLSDGNTLTFNKSSDFYGTIPVRTF